MMEALGSDAKLDGDFAAQRLYLTVANWYARCQEAGLLSANDGDAAADPPVEAVGALEPNSAGASTTCETALTRCKGFQPLYLRDLIATAARVSASGGRRLDPAAIFGGDYSEARIRLSLENSAADPVLASATPVVEECVHEWEEKVRKDREGRAETAGGSSVSGAAEDEILQDPRMADKYAPEVVARRTVACSAAAATHVLSAGGTLKDAADAAFNTASGIASEAAQENALKGGQCSEEEAAQAGRDVGEAAGQKAADRVESSWTGGLASPEMWARLGKESLRVGNFKTALSCAEHAIEMLPESTTMHGTTDGRIQGNDWRWYAVACTTAGRATVQFIKPSRQDAVVQERYRLQAMQFLLSAITYGNKCRQQSNRVDVCLVAFRHLWNTGTQSIPLSLSLFLSLFLLLSLSNTLSGTQWCPCPRRPAPAPS
jgi:hypothetical protein